MDPYIGEIKMVGFNFVPQNYAYCDGQSMSIQQNDVLYSLLGVTYGGDGRTIFNLPDMRGRAPVHQGRGPGLTTRRIGDMGGSETTNIPATDVVTGVTTEDDPQPEVGTASAMAASSPSGGQQSVSVMPPYATVNFIIALTGYYPPRS